MEPIHNNHLNVILNLGLGLLLVAVMMYVGVVILEQATVQERQWMENETERAHSICPGENFYYYACEQKIECEHNLTNREYAPIKNEISFCGLMNL